MTDKKFTPGPWSIERYGDGSSLVIHSDADNRVCFMATASSDRPSSHPSIRANARLIAAAPDLYEALKELEAACDERAAAMSGAVYTAMIDAGMSTDALLRLDEARRAASAALAKAGVGSKQDRSPEDV